MGRQPGSGDSNGYSFTTAYRWFEKYQLPVTKVTTNKRTNVRSPSPEKTPEKTTEPKLKEMIEEVSQAIAEGKVADDDIQAVSEGIGTAVSWPWQGYKCP